MATDPPQVFGNRYRIDGLIAEGGMARVYQGTDTVLGRTVAIKVLSASLAVDPAFVARFQREAQSVASLNHPNLVGVYDIGTEGDSHYIVMEYVRGSTLDAVIRQGAPLEPERVAAIAISVCEGLGVAHQKGIVHRDIKPANIMIEPGQQVKVMDFGIAKTSTDGLTQVGAVLGTVKYLAPEQAYGEPVDERADIYALGCVMYEMLTGRPPTSGESLMEIAHKLATEQPPPPSGLNPEVPAYLDRIVMKALSKNPGERYSSTADMALDLRDRVSAPAAAPAAAVAGATPTVVQGAGDRTRVMQRPAAPPPRRLGLLIPALVLLAGGAWFTFANLLGDRTPAPTPTPLELSVSPAAPIPSPTPDDSPTPSPTPTPSPSPSPSETPDDEPTDPPVDPALVGAANAIAGLVNSGVASGSISERAGRNVIDEVEDVVSEAEKGDLEDAAANVVDAREEVAKYLEREEMSPQDAAAINAQLNRMAAALG